MNYRVVLADDEPEVLRSIQRTLDWEKYGFSVVGAFLNGLDVLEFLENHDVDIVFTDIRMPFMDGIELMHKIKEKYPYIKLVIISGYDDFQYAKEALIHGVLDYILKPINAREMSEVLQKVKDKMDTELEEKQSIQKLRKLYLENQPIIRENFLNRLVLGNIKEKALQEEKKTGLIRMGEYKYWATALAQIYQIEQKDHGETMDSQLASIYIRNLIRKMKEYLIKADMSSNSYQAYSMSVINALLVFARQQDLEIEEVFDGIPNYLEIMQKYASADTFMEWLEEQCIRLNANQGRERENKAKGIIEEAKQKIQEEFGDPDIGLEKIAAEVGLTQTYFSSLFKKETGMSFVEYLTDTRMKEAMRLLKETNEKIYVVAQKVGYLESGYFSHVFKKKYGMSPIQCRRQGQ